MKKFFALLFIVISAFLVSCSMSSDVAKSNMSHDSSYENIPAIEDRYSDNSNIPDIDNGVQQNRENPFVNTSDQPGSTFSIDVDTASYSYIRRYIMGNNTLPPAQNIRIEEMINYFSYDYPEPADGNPFSTTMEMAPAPWNSKNRLLMIGLHGKTISKDKLPESNLVFLLDVSGSMSSDDKLPLLKKSFLKLVDQLSAKDHVAIVTYAGSATVVLNSTSGDQKEKIRNAINSLTADGSTAGGEGLQLAYDQAEKNYNSDGNNRVILASDGDFNVGVSTVEGIKSIIEEKRKKGIFLTTLGFGMSDFRDDMMETLADCGNGNFAYIDSEREGEKVFVKDLVANMFVIAKDVKLQVVFNPDKISKYRLIGYENRVMNNTDFNNDKKDAGEIGSGHSVTAFYEIELAETDDGEPGEIVDSEGVDKVTFTAKDMVLMRIRYKEPDSKEDALSKYLETMFNEDQYNIDKMSENFAFASSVAEFGLLLRDSAYKSEASWINLRIRASKAVGKDQFGYRGEFLEIVDKAKLLIK